jgi:hypothetical protein
MSAGAALRRWRFVHEIEMLILVGLIGQPDPSRREVHKHKLAHRIGHLPGQAHALGGGGEVLISALRHDLPGG